MTIGFSHGSEFLDALLASLADAVYLVGPAGEVRFANPAAVGLLGYTAEAELLGRPSHATIHSHHPDGSPFPEGECPLLRPLVAGETVRVELDHFVRRDGSFLPVGYASAPMDMADGRGAVVVFRDLTERLASDEVAASRARIVAATDAERRRIGRDLHDGAQQRLVRALMGIDEARREPARAEAALTRAAADARHAIRDLRELATGLHPLVLTDRGICAALEELTAGTPLPVGLDVTDERFAPEVEAAAYFLVAEAITNAVKHAGATGVDVTVARDGDTLRIAVSDDGCGGADPAKGSGLRGIEDRVAVLGGTLELAGAPGTTVAATLPLGAG
ncbi:histidine kinase [Solirubrobacter ginsenosidimutans]|uniref:histidine kinase n=1 Tax=Solirubrobacter ginsenosidimutans TaxID=490573 RepID=A0A9X3MPU1_9ACTN|nr:histidine kinase [Solirubrobacter ginsenosidimutans]MDA0160182.1 histidine kinase [Solirubrobacter ginsenosidimutans]